MKYGSTTFLFCGGMYLATPGREAPRYECEVLWRVYKIYLVSSQHPLTCVIRSFVSNGLRQDSGTKWWDG